MKALTIQQPWATLIAIGAKHIETRSWSTNYRGPLAIHAGKSMPAYAVNVTNRTPEIYSALRDSGYTVRIQLKGDYQPVDDRRWLPAGVIVATCELVGCIPILPWTSSVFLGGRRVVMPPQMPELVFGDYTSGRYAWILANVKPLPEPIPAKGAQGLWNWEAPDGLS